nr:alpha/beta hydrolase [Dietzia maris]
MQADLEERLIPVPMDASGAVDIYSGVARISGRVWAREVRVKGSKPRTAVVLCHPTANFLGHYLLDDLARSGVAAVGMTTRYIGNDSALLLENCVLDVSATVARLRADYDKVVVLGNSGGGGLAPLYQSQAERPTIRQAPGGGGPDLTTSGLVAADALILLNAHPSRALLRAEWIDPAIVDEAKPFVRTPSLDMFDPANGPAYPEHFIAAYRAAQTARVERITAWVLGQVEGLARRGGGLTDLPFVVHGTTADLRFLDPAIDPNDRDLGVTLWGPPQTANYLPASLAHFTTLRSWLSQWSLEHTNAGVQNFSEIAAPILVVLGTADPTVMPSHTRQITDAIVHTDWERIDVPGGTHYFEGRPDLVRDVARFMADWLGRHDML